MFRRAIVILGIAMTAHANAQTSQQTRTSAFEYELSSGLLIREVVEPNDSSLCLVTTYAYDPYGNRTDVTTRNCNGSPFNDGQSISEAAAPTCPGPTCDAVIPLRTSRTSFAVDTSVNTVNLVPGQFPITSTNALLQHEYREFDPRFGVVTKLTGPNGLATNWTPDGFGRRTLESRADGTVTNWNYERCDNLPINTGTCPPLAKYRVRVTASGAPETATYYDSLNRAIRTQTQGFDGTPIFKDTQYDAKGRVSKVSQAFVTEGSQVWTTFGNDLLGRAKQIDGPTVNGASTRTVTDYNGLITTVTVSNAGSAAGMPNGATQVKTTTRNSQGQVISVIRQ